MDRRRIVLLIEDDEDLVSCLRLVLEENGFGVVDASDGDAALRACRASPAVALVDLHIAGEPSGEPLIRELRLRLPAGAHVILLSGERDLAERARRLGAEGFLEKPFDADTLLRLVAAHAPPVEETEMEEPPPPG